MHNGEKENIRSIINSINTVLEILPPDLRVTRTIKKGFSIKYPPAEVMSEYDITKYLKFKEYNNFFTRFENVLKEKLPHCNHSGFYKNVKKLKFSTKSSWLEKRYLRYHPETMAIYSGNKNKLSLFQEQIEKARLEDDKDGVVNHELLHMSTARKDGNHYFCGFEQTDRKSRCFIGRGLNEGYTEYLNRKYFSTEDDFYYYFEERHLAKGIERIIGKEKMEQLYFASDLHSLVMELSKYTTIDKIASLINKIDRMQEEEMFVDYCAKLYTELKEEIVEIYGNKQVYELKNGNITEEEFNKRVKYVTRAYLSDVLLSDDLDILETDGKVIMFDETQKIMVNKESMEKYHASNKELSSMLNKTPHAENSNHKKI